MALAPIILLDAWGKPAPTGWTRCPDCGGYGAVEVDGPTPWHSTQHVTCDTCDGDGVLPPEAED